MTSPSSFSLVSPFQPTGDQPGAIQSLIDGLDAGERYQVLLGATGTGKTFTMANVIAKVDRPALIISHNKTLAAQLFEEMRALFPESAVSYFVSYYDYYQPEAYIPQRDIYIEKDAARNDDLDRLRLAATSTLLSRRDCIIVASVSSIFGLGSPTHYANQVLLLETRGTIARGELLLSLTDMQYQRRDVALERGTFRVRGDVVEIFPAYEQFALRVETFGDTIERIDLIHPTSGETLATETRYCLFPAVHYVLPEEHLAAAVTSIREELDERVLWFRSRGKLLEAQRLLARTKYDLEMIQEVGYCPGVENYARHLEQRPPGSRPSTLMDYFHHVPGVGRDEWLVFLDESHVTIPQLRAMYNGDKARKQVLVDHGFRLPSAMDNRPLTFDEFLDLVPHGVMVSATPGPWELEQSGGVIVEQVIRPTGLLDPIIEIRPAKGQVPDLIEACKERRDKGDRVLVTVLTKRLAEDLADYMHKAGLRVRYLHSDIDTLERLKILRDLREGTFDVLVGVNLLREGLDLPEVSLVAILDADKAGFLRSTTSLIQTIGRAARNVDAYVIMYADSITAQMKAAIDETDRRRDRQIAYNIKHGIKAETIKKAIRRGLEQDLSARRTAQAAIQGGDVAEMFDRIELITQLEGEMLDAAAAQKFERAAELRDEVAQLRSLPDTPEHDEVPRIAQESRSSAGTARSSRPRGRKKR
jgi:excinuclease ABC subunit B